MYRIDEWRQKISKKDAVKSYKHLDKKIDVINNDKDFELVKSTLKDLKDHQFLPFIKRTEVIVRYKRGKCTCGNLQKNITCLKTCGYQQKKKSSKPRPIMYASHLDSMVYSYYNFILSESYEKKLIGAGLEKSVTAYRRVPLKDGSEKNKCNIHFAKESFDYIAEKSNCAVITADISGFFDNLDHQLLLRSIKAVTGITHLDKLYKVYKSVTKYRYIDYYSSFNTPAFKTILSKSRYKIYLGLKEYVRSNKSNKGIPQGSPISGLLSNIYMFDFDFLIISKYPDIFYRRYSDDILLVCNQEEVSNIKSFLFNLITESKLEIQSEKTNVATFKDGVCIDVADGGGLVMRRRYVDYLGFEFHGDKTFMRKKSFNKLKRKQKNKVKRRVHNTTYVSDGATAKRKKARKSDYLKKAQKVFDTREIIKQIKSLSRSRNITRKIAVLKKSLDEEIYS